MKSRSLNRYRLLRKRILRVTLSLSLFFVFFVNLKAQETTNTSTAISLGYPVYSQYLQNGLVINPAYAGTRGALCSFLSYRMQWSGTEGAPQMQSLSLHTPLKNDKVALGLTGQFMQYGYNTKVSSIYANYAYHIKLAQGKLSLGLRGGVDLSNSNYAGIETNPQGLPDPAFPATDEKYLLPNAGAGVYYFSEKIFGGLAIPQFLSYNRSSSGSPQAIHSFSDYDFIVSGGGLISFSDFFKFKPSFLLNYSLNEAEKMKQLDLNGNFILDDIVWIGGSWRTTEEVVVGILQLQVSQKLMIGFSYDYPVGRMNSYASGSKEFTLRYEFGSKISSASPRYF